MPQLGNLGSQLLQAAKDSDSNLADLITTQKQTIDQERKAKFRKISGKKPSSRKPPRKKQMRRTAGNYAQNAPAASQPVSDPAK